MLIKTYSCQNGTLTKYIEKSCLDAKGGFYDWYNGLNMVLCGKNGLLQTKPNRYAPTDRMTDNMNTTFTTISANQLDVLLANDDVENDQYKMPCENCDLILSEDVHIMCCTKGDEEITICANCWYDFEKSWRKDGWKCDEDDE